MIYYRYLFSPELRRVGQSFLGIAKAVYDGIAETECRASHRSSVTLNTKQQSRPIRFVQGRFGSSRLDIFAVTLLFITTVFSRCVHKKKKIIQIKQSMEHLGLFFYNDIVESIRGKNLIICLLYNINVSSRKIN